MNDYSTAIDLDGAHASAYSNRGSAQHDLGNYVQAIADLNRAIQLDPTLYKAYCNRGVVYGDMGQYREAIRDLTTAIGIDPDLPHAYINRGRVYLESGDPQRALDYSTQGIRLGPEIVEAYCNRGMVYCRLGEHGKAIADFEAQIQNQGDETSGLPVHIQIEDGRLRIRAGRTRLGSWPLSEISVERLTPFRFRMVAEGDQLIVTPDDPTGFAAASGAFIDAGSSRFGLADRIRALGES